MGLEADRVQLVGSQQQIQEAWSEYVQEDDIIVSWNAGALTLLAQAIATPPQIMHLKSTYCSHHKGKSGTLSALVARLGLEVPKFSGAGRAGVAVAESIALLRHLRAAAMSR